MDENGIAMGWVIEGGGECCRTEVELMVAAWQRDCWFSVFELPGCIWIGCHERQRQGQLDMAVKAMALETFSMSESGEQSA